MADIIKEAQNQIGNTIGTGSPEEQIIGSVILAAFVIMTSSIGLVGTLVLVPVVLLFAFIGFIRLIPAVDDMWPL